MQVQLMQRIVRQLLRMRQLTCHLLVRTRRQLSSQLFVRRKMKLCVAYARTSSPVRLLRLFGAAMCSMCTVWLNGGSFAGKQSWIVLIVAPQCSQVSPFRFLLRVLKLLSYFPISSIGSLKLSCFLIVNTLPSKDYFFVFVWCGQWRCLWGGQWVCWSSAC